MSTEKVFAENTINGEVAVVPAHYLTHPTLGAHLKERRTGKPVAQLPKAEAPTKAPEKADKEKSK